ncbi:MAG: hypothetical protein H6996_06745 [Moraxellaceae bacterium]|nr:hypothetical protein [Pseudomonadales bacterium]MCP5174783.1 hypothetical protein [Moraxellaceae bacterium]
MVKPERPKFVIPLSYLLLDMVGVILFGLGCAMVLGKQVLPPELLFIKNQGWLLIVVSLFCMLPMIVFVLKAVRHTKQQDALWYNQLPPQFKAKLEAKINESKR